jgi:hypothetical protein
MARPGSASERCSQLVVWMKLLMTAANWGGWSSWRKWPALARMVCGWSLAPGMRAISGAAPPTGLSDDQLKAYVEELIAALVQDPDYGLRSRRVGVVVFRCMMASNALIQESTLIAYAASLLAW